jgi:hypothetical protein
MGGGVGTLVLLVIMLLMGADPKALLDVAMQGVGQSASGPGGGSAAFAAG